MQKCLPAKLAFESELRHLCFLCYKPDVWKYIRRSKALLRCFFNGSSGYLQMLALPFEGFTDFLLKAWEERSKLVWKRQLPDA